MNVNMSQAGNNGQTFLTLYSSKNATTSFYYITSFLFRTAENRIWVSSYTGTTYYTQWLGTSIVPAKTWKNVVFTISTNSLNRTIELYVNGIKQTKTSNPVIPYQKGVITQVYVGGYVPGWGNAFYNGTMDNVRIYNRSLSANEIKLLNLSKDNIIHSDETKAGEVWSSCITPNDGTSDGTRVCSNNNTIANLQLINCIKTIGNGCGVTIQNSCAMVTR